jgi:hypothetical protein
MIIDGFATLADVKRALRITDTTNDSLLEQIISDVSAKVVTYCKQSFKRATYTSEPYAVNNQLFLYLNNAPIASVASVVVSGAALVPSVAAGYYMSGEDALAGRLYKPSGWYGTYYQRGTFPDTFAGARDIAVTYTAGYYLPADALYVAGSSTALPMSITFATIRETSIRYNKTIQNGDGLIGLTEGGLSYQWTMLGRGNSGLTDETCASLSNFVRVPLG